MARANKASNTPALLPWSTPTVTHIPKAWPIRKCLPGKADCVSRRQR